MTNNTSIPTGSLPVGNAFYVKNNAVFVNLGSLGSVELALKPELVIQLNELNLTINELVENLNSEILDRSTNETELAAEIARLTQNVFINIDIPVSLSNGKTLGRYANGELIPSTGKTPQEVFLMISQEPIKPSLTLSSATVVQFNQTAISNVLNFSMVINSLGATAASAILQYRRGNSGTWEVLSDLISDVTFTHILTDSNFNTAVFNYRYVVLDSSGGEDTVLLNIQPYSYSLPTRVQPISSATKELGNISSTLGTSVVKNSPFVNLVSCKLQRQVDNGAWTDLQSSVAISSSANGFSTGNFVDSTAPINSTTIRYRLEVVDTYATNYSTSGVISLVYKSVIGYNTASSIDLATLLTMGNSSLTNSKSRTVTVTAEGGTFTYYGYNASTGDLSGIVKDGTTPDLGAWTKLATLLGLNSFGATVTYTVYKTNSTNAYTNNILTTT